MLKHKRLILKPAGADGAAVATGSFSVGKHGLVRAIKVDYQNQPVTTDITLTDGYGNVLFTRTSSATDIALSPCGRPGVDEAGGATAATDGVSGGWPFISGVYAAVAEGDGQTSGDEKIVIDLIVEED
jgi:hypothetical protein